MTAKLVSAFFEKKEFPKNEPWSVIELASPAKRGGRWTTQPHYADTIEFIFTDGIEGEAYIGGTRHEFGAKTALYIPPRKVHSVNYESGDGTVFCTKLNPEGLMPFLDLATTLSVDGTDFESFAYRSSRYDDLIADFFFLTGEAGFVQKAARVLTIFTHLDRKEDGNECVRSNRLSEELCEIIAWTEQNVCSNLTLEKAAKHFCYNKHYFCDKFSKAVGVSYTRYVNALRITKACEMIENGTPTGEILQKCGFATESYYIQLFSRVKGCTPGEYRKAVREE